MKLFTGPHKWEGPTQDLPPTQPLSDLQPRDPRDRDRTETTARSHGHRAKRSTETRGAWQLSSGIPIVPGPAGVKCSSLLGVSNAMQILV